jgi:16S rRNA G966 N2-methylase RsmD
MSKKNNIKLKITDKGLYSISKYNDAEWISNLIINFLKSKNIDSYGTSIIDATAGIGGNTISFSKYFLKIYSVEINKVHYEVLNNNLDALSIKNVQTYHNNFFKIIDNLIDKSNIFFFDPPWGGNSYKNYTYFNLKIGNMQLFDVINILYEKKYKYIILKAPYNLNLSIIYNQIKYKNMIVHSNSNKNMIIIIFY